jgi:predicted nucleotidyltransferase
MTESALHDALRDLQIALSPLSGKYMLIGGLAVVLRGFPRHTDDIDITVLGTANSVVELHDSLSKAGFEARLDNAVEFAEQNQVLLMRHRKSAIEVDVTVAWLPFESEAIAAAETTNIEGVMLPVARGEDLIIYKAVAWRERDRRDITELWKLHSAQIDRERILAVVASFAEAIEEPDRVGELEKLLSR